MSIKDFKNLRRQYDDAYKAMGNDAEAVARLRNDGLIAEGCPTLLTLYNLGNNLCKKLQDTGDTRYIEVSARRAENELSQIAHMQR